MLKRGIRKGAIGIVLLLGLQIASWGQLVRTWDGEGGDSSWSNGVNWHPNGLPAPTDTILLTNALVPHSYHVQLPTGTMGATIAALMIAPENPFTITLEIPSTNTASPALQLMAPDTCMRIKQGGVIINRSTAATGNPIVLTGIGRIENGGKYLHQTLRGNAHWVARLSWDKQNAHGMIEFDVPGNGGYILSISGRQFGTLILSSSLAGRKTYSGSGSSKLIIWGELRIQSNSTLNFTLNNQIELYNDVHIEGKWIHAPSVTDLLGKRILFKGEHARLSVKGEMQWGSRSNGIRLENGLLQLATSLRLGHDSCAMEILDATHLYLDTSKLTGPGMLITQANSFITLGDSIGISGDTLRGNIQTQKIQLSKSTGFAFIGTGRHHTGKGFPDAIGTLKNRILQGELLIDNKLSVRDTLLLLTGKVLVCDSAELTFLGNTLIDCDTCYVKGWLYRKNDRMVEFGFPIGNDLLKLPLTLIKDVADTSIIGFNSISNHPISSSSVSYPLQSISEATRWKIHCADSDSTNKKSIVIPISMFSSPPSPLNTLARWDSTRNMWAHVASPNQMGKDSIRTIPFRNPSGVYALASFNVIALPERSVQLSSSASKEGCRLRWVSSTQLEVMHYTIEVSSQGGSFRRIDSLPSHGKSIMEKTLACHLFRATTLRVVAHLVHRDSVVSNTIQVKSNWSEVRPFPNPTSESLWIYLPESTYKSLLAIGIDGKQFELPYKKWGNEVQVDVHGLRSGMYRLLVTRSGQLESIPFIKR